MSHGQSCHIYNHATYKPIMSHIQSCHIYNHVTYTIMSHIKLCHMCNHVTYKSLASTPENVAYQQSNSR